MGRKITILGMGGTAIERRIDILNYVKDTEIWGLNNGYVTFPHLQGHWNRFFELHRWEYVKDWKNGQNTDHFQCLMNLGCEVVTGIPLPLIRKQKVYPFIEVCRHFETNYFLGSPSLMLMLALYEHDLGNTVEEIRSYGIDTMDSQHGQQRTSWAWWLRAAHERKILLTGTSCAYMSEFENDDGLRGLRQEVATKIIADMKKENVEKQLVGVSNG